jgi:hypothetical protein
MKRQEAGRRKRDLGRHGTWKWTVLALLVCGSVLYMYLNRVPQTEHTSLPGSLAPGVTPRIPLAPPPIPLTPPPIPLPPPRGGPMPGMPRGGGQSFAAVDLNSATLAELQTLPGMTSEYARKIIAGRPFHGLDDLERAGIPRDVFERMSPPAMIRWGETGLPSRGSQPDAAGGIPRGAPPLPR